MNLQEWIGKSEAVSDIATATPYAALAATLDRAPERPSARHAATRVVALALLSSASSAIGNWARRPRQARRILAAGAAAASDVGG